MSYLRYSGHPFIDVGVATLTAMTKKARPEDLVLDDLESAAEYLKDIYSRLPKVRNQLSAIFQNSQFTQPSSTEATRLEYADQFLFAFRPDRPILDGVACTFFPEKPASMFAYRQHVPLLNGSGILNFVPSGTRGVPMSGIALLAIHAFPLGCMKCGNYLAIHQIRGYDSDGPDMTLLLAKEALQQYRQAVQLMRVDPATDFPSLKRVRTRYVEAILNAGSTAAKRRTDTNNLTGYYFTNFGNNANVEIVRLDNAILDFVNAAQQDAEAAWSRVVGIGWETPKEAKDTPDGTSDKRTWRNATYEALFLLPQNNRQFIRLLAQAHNWGLIEIFLRKVMLMEQERIDTYRKLGDRLVDYMDTHEGDSLGFYYRFSRAKDYAELRNILRSAAERVAKAGASEPLFTYDGFVYAFEDPTEGSRQWRLGRDLIAIRMLESLHRRSADLKALPVEDEDEPAAT